MRARLSAISNFTTSQLLTILQNWITNTSKIMGDGQVLTVTRVYFLSNDTSPTQTSNNESNTVFASATPYQTSSNEPNKKINAIQFSVIGSAGGLSLFLCICCIIISVCTCQKFKPKRNDNLKPKFVIYIF